MIKQYFNDKGIKLFKIAPRLSLLFIIITLLCAIKMPVSVLALAIILLPVYIIIAIIPNLLPNTFAGRWTPEGKEFHDKWKNFEKYIKDYSYIAQRPPASVQIWGKYLVYAAALGCADEATKNMKYYFNTTNQTINLSDSSAVFFTYFDGFAQVERLLVTLSHPENNNSGSGIGRVGGGGGGGTF